MRRTASLLAAAVAGLVGLSCSESPSPQRAAETTATTNATQTSEAHAAEAPAATPLEGLWSGSWGGGGDGEVIMQPVLAEMVVLGNKVEWRGFREPESLAGTVAVDEGQRKVRVTPAPADAEGGDHDAAAGAVEFGYELAGDDLTLTDAEGIAMMFHRLLTVRKAVVNVQVSLVSARGMNERGDLLCTEFGTLVAGREERPLYERWERAYTISQVLLVEQDGLKEIPLDEARGMLSESTPVAVTFSETGIWAPYSEGSLWRHTGPASPDSDVARETLLKTLRPGTLVFVGPSSQLHPPP